MEVAFFQLRRFSKGPVSVKTSREHRFNPQVASKSCSGLSVGSIDCLLEAGKSKRCYLCCLRLKERCDCPGFSDSSILPSSVVSFFS